MKINILKIMTFGFVATIIGGLSLIWPSFSLAQLPQDFPIMEMTKTVDKAEVQPGEFLTYTLHCQNTGQWTAYDVEIEDSLPEGVSLESTSFPMSYLSQRELQFALPDLVSGDGQTIFIKVRVDDETKDGTVLVNNAILSYGDGQRKADPLVFATARSVIRLKPIVQAPTQVLTEIAAPVGSYALMVNLGLSLLAACLGVFILYLILRWSNWPKIRLHLIIWKIRFWNRA